MAEPRIEDLKEARTRLNARLNKADDLLIVDDQEEEADDDDVQRFDSLDSCDDFIRMNSHDKD